MQKSNTDTINELFNKFTAEVIEVIKSQNPDISNVLTKNLQTFEDIFNDFDKKSNIKSSDPPQKKKQDKKQDKKQKDKKQDKKQKEKEQKEKEQKKKEQKEKEKENKINNFLDNL